MATVGLLDFKTDASFYFDTVDNILEKCCSNNLLNHAIKDLREGSEFQKSVSYQLLLFINGSVIDKVEHFNYLGTLLVIASNGVRT